MDAVRIYCRKFNGSGIYTQGEKNNTLIRIMILKNQKGRGYLPFCFDQCCPGWDYFRRSIFLTSELPLVSSRYI